MSVRGALAAAALCVGLPVAVSAQKLELSVIGVRVQAAPYDVDRITSTGLPPYQLGRSRTHREPGNAWGLRVSHALHGPWRLEGGYTAQDVERTTQQTALGSPDDPFTASFSVPGTMATAYVGLGYRFSRTEGRSVTLIAAPMVVQYGGNAHDPNYVAGGAPEDDSALGALVGLRVQYRVLNRLSVQLGAEDAIHRYAPYPLPGDSVQDPSPTSRDTPILHDIRLTAGLTLRIF